MDSGRARADQSPATPIAAVVAAVLVVLVLILIGAAAGLFRRPHGDRFYWADWAENTDRENFCRLGPAARERYDQRRRRRSAAGFRSARDLFIGGGEPVCRGAGPAPGAGHESFSPDMPGTCAQRLYPARGARAARAEGDALRVLAGA